MADSFVLVIFTFFFAEAFSFSLHHQDYPLNSKAEYEFLKSLLGPESRRVARDVDMVHPPKCCGHKDLVITEDDQQMMKGCEPHGNAAATTVCWMECMAQKKHSVDAEGYVITQNFTEIYLKHFTDESVKDLTVKSIDECAKIANEKAKNLGPEESNGNKCNRAASLTSLCVRYKVETGCPEEDKVKTDECNTVREDIKGWASKLQ